MRIPAHPCTSLRSITSLRRRAEWYVKHRQAAAQRARQSLAQLLATV